MASSTALRKNRGQLPAKVFKLLNELKWPGDELFLIVLKIYEFFFNDYRKLLIEKYWYVSGIIGKSSAAVI